MADRMRYENNVGTQLKNIVGSLTGNIPQLLEEGAKEANKVNESIRNFASASAKRDKNNSDLLEKNLGDVVKLAMEGNESAKQLLDLDQKFGREYKELLEKVHTGQELTLSESKKLVKFSNAQNNLMKETKLAFQVDLAKMLDQNDHILQSNKVDISERRKATDENINLLKSLGHDLTENGKALLDEYMKTTNSNFEPEVLNSLHDTKFLIGDLNTITKKKMSVRLDDLDGKLRDIFDTGEESTKYLKTIDKNNAEQKGFFEKTGLDKVASKVKAGGADFLLQIFGLGGMGIGEFITEHWEDIFKEIGKRFSQVWSFLKSPMEHLKALGETIMKPINLVKKLIMNTFDGISDITKKIKNAGESAIELVGKTAKNMKGMFKSFFGTLSDGFQGFWKSSLDIMKKGGGLIGTILMGLVSGLGSLISGGGSLLSSAGGMALGGAKYIGKGLLAGGKLLGKGIKGLGKAGGAALGGVLSAGFTGYEAYQDYQTAKENGASPEELRKLKGQGISKTVGSGVGGAVGGALGALTGPLAPLLIPVFSMLGSTVGEWLGKKIYDFLDNGGAKKIMDGVKKGLDYLFGQDGIFMKAKDFLVDLSTKFTWDNIKSVFSMMSDKIMEFFNVDNIKKTVQSAIEAGKNMLSGDSIVDGIKNFITSIFDVMKEVFIGFVPGAGLVKGIKEWLTSGGPVSAGGADASAVSSVQTSMPQAMGNVSNVDTNKSTALAKADIVNQAVTQDAGQGSNAAPVNVPVSSSGGRKGGGLRTTQIDDLGIATLNSILFE